MMYEGSYSNTTFRKSQTAFPLGHQSLILHHFEHLLAHRERLGPMPSCGLKAFLTFALLCNSLDVYGFGEDDDWSTVDGHKLNHHDFTGEHALQRNLAEGRSDGIDWLVTAGGFFRDEFAAFQAKLKCMSAKG